MGDFRSNLPLGTTDKNVFVNGNIPNVDEAVNAQYPEWLDRFGVSRLTWFGMEENVRLAILKLNYSKVDYQAGNVIDTLLQYVIAPDSNAYVISPSVPLPYTLTGDWATDSPNFWLGQDAMLRSQLAGSGGAGMIGTPRGFLENDLTRLMTGSSVSPLLYGYNLNASDLDTPQKVDSNWGYMKEFILSEYSEKTYLVPKKKLTLHDAFRLWAEGENCPIGFYSDSTTDGATTTGHVPSIPNTGSFGVTINESPNAYPAVMLEYLPIILQKNTAKVYNGGFDSQSFSNGFGLRHWYNTWFRPSGSNKNWTDVKLIVIGFGTSDSMNDGNLKEIADRYALDLECVIIDCLLRGVTPVLQGPVPTAQSTATTVLGRKGRESITVIETIQKRLCEKYDLEWLSYRESFEDAIYNYQTIKYRDLMAPDMVHPTDMGHAIHAGYLLSKIVPNVLVFDGSPESLYCGSQFWNYPSNMNISPPSAGGSILKQVVGSVVSAESFFYGWRASDGNSVSSDETLLRAFIYCKKPCSLQDVDAVLHSGGVSNFLAIFNTATKNQLGTALSEKRNREVSAVYSRYRTISRVPFGFSILAIVSGQDGDASFYGARLCHPDDTGKTLNGFGTSGAYYLHADKGIKPYSLMPGTSKAYLPEDYFNQAYNPSDNQPLSLIFKVIRGGSSAIFRTHYNSINAPLDSYMEITYSNSLIEVFSVKSGDKTKLGQIEGTFGTISSGDIVELSFKTAYFSSSNSTVSIFKNGANIGTVSYAPMMAWRDGCGAYSSIDSEVSVRASTGVALINNSVMAYV